MANTHKLSASERIALRRAEQAREENRQKYEAARSKQRPLVVGIFLGAALIALITLIVTLTADVVYIHNTGMTEDGGREVTVGGMALLRALFSNNFSSAEYDNLAVPFYYYAPAWCTPLAAFTLLAVIAGVLSLVLSAAALIQAAAKREYAFSWFALIGTGLSFLMTCIAFFTALSMSGSQILPVYCGGNPQCSIQSDLVWCFLLGIVALGGCIFALVAFRKMDKLHRAAFGR